MIVMRQHIMDAMESGDFLLASYYSENWGRDTEAPKHYYDTLSEMTLEQVEQEKARLAQEWCDILNNPKGENHLKRVTEIHAREREIRERLNDFEPTQSHIHFLTESDTRCQYIQTTVATFKKDEISIPGKWKYPRQSNAGRRVLGTKQGYKPWTWELLDSLEGRQGRKAFDAVRFGILPQTT